MGDCKVYVGGLPNDATSEEIEDAFRRFGRIRKVRLLLIVHFRCLSTLVLNFWNT